MPLELVLTDRLGVEQGQLRGAITNRSLTPNPLKALGSLAFTVRADNPLVPLLALGDRTLIKAYDRDLSALPLLNGPVIGFEKNRDEQGGTVSIAAASAGWRLGVRLIGKSLSGSIYGSASSQIDRGEAMGRVLDEMNADEATGIIRGSIVSSVPGFFGPWLYKPGLEALNEIGAPLDSPDWQIAPLDTATRTDGALGQLNVAPAFGSDRPNAVWEFGTGKKNVKSWRHVINPGTLANRAYQLPTVTGQSVQTWQDDASRASHGLAEALVAGDLTSDALRLALVQAHVQLRREPSQVLTFEPRMDAVAPSGPPDRLFADLKYGTDYGEGDTIRFHALERFPITDLSTGARIGTQEVDTVDVAMRCYAITFTYDAEGNRTPAFTLVAENAS